MGEQRYLIAAVTIFAILLFGIIAILLQRSVRVGDGPSDDGPSGTDPVSATVIVPADPDSETAVRREAVPATVLQRTETGPAGVPQIAFPLDEDVLFDFDSAALRPDAPAQLAAIVERIRVSGDDVVDVVGFADSIGSQDYNLALSRARADSVAAYLTTLGIGNRRLNVQWRGEEDPVAPNTGPQGQDNPAGRQLNRRVEIRIDDNGVIRSGVPASPLGAAAHPNGTAIAVDRVVVTETGILLTVRIVNGAPYPVELNEQSTWLVDDLGNVYRFVPSWQNPTLVVPAGDTLSGEMAFPGIVPDRTSSFTLVTNSDDPLDQLGDTFASVEEIVGLAVSDAQDVLFVLGQAGSLSEIADALDALSAGESGVEDAHPTIVIVGIPR
jgi:outer membrane protein OmpA-like peptidoglycan-associated protein